MSRPRKPFGVNHPGRLPATMIKVLAAEMSDPARLRRGKQYARDGSVLDIVIEPGMVTCEVQGSRSTPYVAAVIVSAGSGMPLRRDVVTQCTCPDDDNFDGYACKHAVAAMFVLSDEFLMEPELLDVWRGNLSGDAHERDIAPGATRDGTNDDTDDGVDERGDDARDEDADERRHRDAGGSSRPERRRGHLRLVGSHERVAAQSARPAPAPIPQRDRSLDGLLDVPEGAELPEVPRLAAIESIDPADRRLAAALRDAREHLRLDWD